MKKYTIFILTPKPKGTVFGSFCNKKSYQNEHTPPFPLFFFNSVVIVKLTNLKAGTGAPWAGHERASG